MSAEETAISFLAGLISGTVVGVASSYVTGRMQDKGQRENATADLLAEMKQNQHHQEVSFLIPLEDEAYKRFRRVGLMAKLNPDVHTSMLELYSRIHNKNGLVSLYLDTRGEIVIQGGPKPENVRDTLSGLRAQIDDILAEMIPIFERGEQNDNPRL